MYFTNMRPYQTSTLLQERENFLGNANISSRIIIFILINFKYLKIISDMHFKTPIQVYIEQNVKGTTVQTRNEEKKFSTKY